MGCLLSAPLPAALAALPAGPQTVRPLFQERLLGGKVTGATGEPLAGVSVTVRGTTRGATSGADGTYRLALQPGDQVLVFSSVGFTTKEIAIGNQTQLDLELAASDQQLDEVVVIGYGTVRKRDLTGSVASIKGDRLLDRPSTNVAQALQGRVPGVDVSVNSAAPGYAPRIRIRGVNSINSNVEPLYVVDGLIGVANPNLLNPNDIESVEVLKDASATAIYGARGANGVILITTKRGLKNQSKISYDAWASYLKPARYVGALNASEFMKVYNLAFANAKKYDTDGFTAGKYVPNDPKNFPKLFDASGNPLYNTDWERLVYRPTWGQNHEIGIRGGGDKTTYSLSGGYNNQGGIMINSWFKRYSLKLSMDSEVRKWLSVGGMLLMNRSVQRVSDDASGGLNVPRMVMEALPILPVKYPDGTWGRNKDWPGMEGGENPVRIATERQSFNNNNQMLGELYTVVRFSPDLQLRSSLGFDLQNQKNNFYSGRDLNALSADQKGVASISSNQEYYWQFENYFTYNRELRPGHRLTAMGGLSWQKRYWEGAFVASENFIDDFYGWHNLGVGTTRRDPSSGDAWWTLNSYFTRLNYNLFDKYLFTATARYDGSSKFGENNKYGFFPSAAVAWNIGEEAFLKGNPTVSLLKIRASVGKTGNQEIGTYASQQFLSSGNVLLGGVNQTGLWRGSFGNPDLRWEYTTQTDVGLELGLFNQRVSMTVDLYRKVTSDLLLNAPIPWSTGLSSVTQNIGSVENKGVELMLTTQNVQTGSFAWQTMVNFASNRNKILKLGVNNDDIFPGPWFLGQTNILRVGYPIGTFWGYRRLGTWSSAEADEAAKYNRLPGDLKWQDLNSDGRIDGQDETMIGRAYPKWTMNISNTLTWKNFDLTVDIRFVMGVNMVRATKHSTEDRQAIANSSKSVLNAWTPENQNTSIAEIRHYNAGYDTHMDDWWVEDGSHIRGQNFVLGYNFPASLFGEKLRTDRLRVYVSGQNFFLSTKYSGYDPEALTFGGQLTQNIEFFQYPKPRTFNVGLNLTF